MSVLGRLTGIGAAASVTLGLLAGGCVLAATAGPRQTQATGTRALRQTLGSVSPLDKSVAATTDWSSVYTAFGGLSGGGGGGDGPGLQLSQSNLATVTSQLRGDFSGGPLTLAPPSADWAALTSEPYGLGRFPVLKKLRKIPAKLEVAYRYPLAGHLRLVAGSMPTAALPSNAVDTVIQVVITQAMASGFGLETGSWVTIGVPSDENPGLIDDIQLDVTGIVEPTDPDSVFWTTDPLLPGPTLSYTSAGPLWIGAVIADPGELGAMQQIFGVDGLVMQWQLPVNTASLRGQPPALYNQVNDITNRDPQLTGYMAPISIDLKVTSGLLQPLVDLVQESNAVNLVLLMVYVGLAVASAVMLLLAARMIAGRRSAEFTLLRARGASLRQLFWLGFLGAALPCVPAAVIAWTLAVLLIPNAAPLGPAAWWPGLAALVIATAGTGWATARPHRLPRRRRAARRAQGQRRARPWVTRVIVEVTAAAAAIGGIVIARTQSGLVDLYASGAPVLVAVLAVIVILRLYQVLVRALARVSARRRGVVGFVGLTRASAATGAFALPALTLVLAVTMASFTGMVKEAVARSEVAGSWQTTGADVAVAAPWAQNAAASLISPSAAAAMAEVPGVTHAASVLVVPLSVDGGAIVTGLVVDPASYAALVKSSMVFPPVNPALLADAGGKNGLTPVLASPQAAADLAPPGANTIYAQQGLPGLRVRIVGGLQSTPAMPGGGAFIVLPRSAIGADANAVNLVLLNGPSINMTRLRAAATPTSANAELLISTRSAALQQLAGAPLQQGTFVLFALAIGYAIALALAVLLLQLALGAPDREVILARLATMGLSERRRGLLAAVEVLPAIIAAAVGAIVCASALPQVVDPALNLSVFTQSQAPVPLQPDAASFALPLAGLALVTVIALGYEVRSRRRRGVAVTMRAS
jgi:putative ABC transport system permease protein